MSMNFRQRQESQANSSIEGKRINNYVTCNVKQVRTLSPQIIQMAGREETFETDSFKQILTKRSLGPLNKENITCNAKKLKKIKQQPTHSKSGGKAKPKSKAKHSASSLQKFLKRSDAGVKKKSKERKSVSPMRDHKDYRSGPSEKRMGSFSMNQYISVNVHSKNSKEGIVGSKSERNLTDRVRNPLKNIDNCNKKKQQKSSQHPQVDKNRLKKRKNVSKTNLLANNFKKPDSTFAKTESLAKQFDALIKCPSTKRERHHREKDKSETTIKKDISSGRLKKSKEKKKVVISNNQSKVFLEKVKDPSDFSSDSRDSPDRILSMKYEHHKNMKKKKRQRLSFEPVKKKQHTKKVNKVKTESLSPEKNLTSQNEAAVTIQRFWRGYRIRKQFAEFREAMRAVETIQRVWRGYQARKKVKEMKERMNRSKDLRIKRFEKIEEIMNEGGESRSIELNCLLEDILREENVNPKIKEKISMFLGKEGKSSGRSSIFSHNELEMKSEKRFFEQFQKKKYQMNSPIIRCSPTLSKSDLHKSPEVVIENLLSIQEFHREKLISQANIQTQDLEKLAMRNFFSPRTHQNKRNEITQKLHNDLKKFDVNFDEIIKSCKESDESEREVKPFEGLMTPERSIEKLKDQEKESSAIDPIDSSQRKIEDQSVELLEYYGQKTQGKANNLYEPFDSSYQFIEQYLLTMFEYLRQGGEEFKEEFVKNMKQYKNLSVGVFLKNLNIVTEDSQDDISFKLPMYKYLEQEDQEIISLQVSEEFNESFTKLQRHQLSYQHTNLEDMYLKMLIDCMNEALNLQRPSCYIFTETNLASRNSGIKMKEIQALQNEDYSESEAEYSFFFAKAMNQIYLWAHVQCGIRESEEMEDDAVAQVNEGKEKEVMRQEAEKRWDLYDELLEVIVGVADSIFDQIVMEEGISLYF